MRLDPSPLSGFDLTADMRKLCQRLVGDLAELAHIEMGRVSISFAQARNRSKFGTYATLTPMRFAGGAMETNRKGRRYRVQRLFDRQGIEQLYILTFYMPRFLDVDRMERLVTVLHELWHISPAFDGDIRRFSGRCYAHSGSQKNYDAAMHQLALQWLRHCEGDSYPILEQSFTQLRSQFGSVYGTRIPHPKLIPCVSGS